VDGEATNAGERPWQLLRDIEYARTDEHRLRLDLYLPQQRQGPLPLVIWVHGGGWRRGSKDACRMVFLVREGFAVASIDYRLAPQAKFPDQLDDCKAAVRFLRANAARYGIDPARIGMAGASAGGHLAALVGLTADEVQAEGNPGRPDVSSHVQAVCDYFGPTDLTAIAGSEWDNERGAVYHLLGGTVAGNMERARQASPLHQVNATAPPFLIIHGQADKTVPVEDSRALAKALEAQGTRVELWLIAEAAHGGPEFFSPPMQRKVADFFTKAMRP
jgi:acetyl esterase/lipase